MLALTKLIISTDNLAPILLCWALGAGVIVGLAALNRRRIRSHDEHL